MGKINEFEGKKGELKALREMEKYFREMKVTCNKMLDHIKRKRETLKYV